MTPEPVTMIYKICEAAQWAEAERAGEFRGSAVDLADGYIHFSTAAQVAETAMKHFGRRPGLVLVAVMVEMVSGSLKWELSRGGGLFPHLYGVLPTAAVRWTKPLPLDAAGTHVLPPELPI